MKLSTFCVLLASVLMLMSALIGGLMKADNESEEEKEAISVINETAEAEVFLSVVSGEVSRRFGAEYSEELGQWTQNDWMMIAVDGRAQISAPADSRIESIEPTDGGSLVTLETDENIIRIWPVTAVRVFEGSRMNKGDIIGTAEESVAVYMETDGRAVNPAGLVESE